MALPRPWLDKKGRFSGLRAVTFVLLWLPAVWYAARYALGDLGARPTHEVLLGFGLWTIWWVIISLSVSPAKAILATPHLVVVRRMIGLAALCYGLTHLTLYAADEKWRLLHVASEIALRFYLTVGFVALLGLCVLGYTSRDYWQKRLGLRWKKLHRYAYAIAALGTFHYFMQTKADVSQAVIVAGAFSWLMLWRLLPAGRDRGPWALLGLALATWVVTLGVEWAWYRLGTRVDPSRVLRGEFDVSFGLRPADQVLALGLLVAAAAELRRLSIGHYADTLWCNVLTYAGSGAIAGLAVLALGWGDDGDPDGPSGMLVASVWTGLFALLGVARWFLGDQPARRWLDALWVGCLLYPVYTAGLSSQSLALAANMVVIGAALVLAARLWTVSRASALLVVPVAAWVGYATTTLL